MAVLVVSGTRRALTPEEKEFIQSKLYLFFDTVKYTSIRVGDAKGVDAVVRGWHTDARVYSADWDTYGKSAGPRRNEEMVEDLGPQDLLIAFPSVASHRGTSNAIECAISKKMKIVVFPVD